MSPWGETAQYWFQLNLGWVRGKYTAKHRYMYVPWWDVMRGEQIATRLLNAPLHRA